MLGLSLPSFVVGSVLLLVFALKLHWLPPSQFVAWQENPGQHLKLLILPVVTLAASTTAVILRMTRSAMLEVIRQDYIRTARAKGIGERVILLRHALRNAVNPVVSLTGLELASLLGGTVIVETIYGWPGLSSLLLSGVRSRDYPVVQGVVLVIAVLTILINLPSIWPMACSTRASATNRSALRRWLHEKRLSCPIARSAAWLRRGRGTAIRRSPARCGTRASRSAAFS